MPYPPSQFSYERRAAYSAVTAFQPPFDPILSVTQGLEMHLLSLRLLPLKFGYSYSDES